MLRSTHCHLKDTAYAVGAEAAAEETRCTEAMTWVMRGVQLMNFQVVYHGLSGQFTFHLPI